MLGKRGSAYARLRRRTAAAGYLVVGWMVAVVGWVLCATIDIELALIVGVMMLLCGVLAILRGAPQDDRPAMVLGLVQVAVVVGLTVLVVVMAWAPQPATIPLLAAGAVYVVASAPFVWRLWQRRVEGFKPWECEACGYPLVGLSGRTCPECGQVFDAEKVRAALPPEMLGMTPSRR